MALGITDRVWTIGNLIDAALATQPITPTVSPGSDRRRRFTACARKGREQLSQVPPFLGALALGRLGFALTFERFPLVVLLKRLLDRGRKFLIFAGLQCIGTLCGSQDW